MNRVTLIVVPEGGRSRMRRLQVRTRPLRFVAAGAVVLALALGGIVADWVRLRREAVDVGAMRAETERGQAQLAALAQDLQGLEEKVGQLDDFERKIRLIADLPAAMPEAHTPARYSGAAASQGGQGGAEEGDAAASIPADVSAPAVESGPSPPQAEGPPPRVGFDDAVGRMRERAERLAARVEGRGTVFERLADRLRGMRERLAATPSIWPTNGWVTSRFGWRISPFTGRRQFHQGLDISADLGRDIVAAARGRVVFAGVKSGFGSVVIVDHGYGIRTIYAHASALHVRAGQIVERGTRVASVGSTGRSTGPHLHYAVSVNGRPVNPASYILD